MKLYKILKNRMILVEDSEMLKGIKNNKQQFKLLDNKEVVNVYKTSGQLV